MLSNDTMLELYHCFLRNETVVTALKNWLSYHLMFKLVCYYTHLTASFPGQSG